MTIPAQPGQHPGFFISIEGFDGAGKTTLVRALVKRIQQVVSPERVFATAEPSGDPFFAALAALASKHHLDVTTKALAFVAARHQHLVTTIAPHLDMNHIVISDRFMDSTTAYQGSLVPHWQDWLRLQSKVLFRKPDITFVLDVTYDRAVARIKQRDGGAGGDNCSSATYQKITKIYHQICQQPNCWLVNANLKPELVLTTVWQKLVATTFFTNICQRQSLQHQT